MAGRADISEEDALARRLALNLDRSRYLLPDPVP
jgi:hypothetical protein